MNQSNDQIFQTIVLIELMRNELYKVEKKQGQEHSKNSEKNTKNLYMKARAYFLSMREKHRRLIEATIQKYSENERFERFVFALNLVLNPITNYQVPHLRAQVMSIFKILIENAANQELQNMPQNERNRYLKTRQNNYYLLTQAKKKVEQQGKINYEINFLLYQDILSLFLLESQLFEKACDSSNTLFYSDDLAELLGLFKKEEVKRFSRYFSKKLPYLKCDGISRKLVQLVKLYTIIILRFRVINIVATIPNYNLLHPTSDLILESLFESKDERNDTIIPYAYYLSEVSIFMYLDDIINIPSSWINGLILLLKEVVKEKNIEQRKWMLLKTKIKFSASFENLFLFLNYLEQDAEEQIHQMFRDLRQPAKDYQKFFQALPYIFLKNESYFQAFQKRGFNQEFDITHVAEGIFKCSPYLRSLMLMSVSFRCAQFGLNMAKLIKLQKLYSKILVIKKYEFSYNKMRSSFARPVDKDIPISLILGTIDDRLIFCQVTFKHLQESEYINSIQRLLLQKLSQPYVIVIHAYYDYTPFSRSSLTSLLKLAKKLKTRVYFLNLGEELGKNTILFAYIYSRMFKKSACCQKDFPHFFSKKLDFQINVIRKWQNQKYEKALQSQSQF